MTATATRLPTGDARRATGQEPGPSGRPTGDGRSTVDPSSLVAELALVFVHVAVVFGFVRVYRSTRFLGPLLAFVLVAHVLAATCRRRSVPVSVVAVIAVAGAALIACWGLFPHTCAWGLPTMRTWDAATHSLRTARQAFRVVAAPAEPLAGFQLAAGLSLSAAVWFADWAAFRLRTAAEAVAPATVAFVFVALLGSGQHQRSATVAFVAAVLVFVAANRAAVIGRDRAWLTASPSAGPRAALRGATAVTLVAVLAGVVIGPRLPGATAEPVVSWRRNGTDSSRITVSPMVELRKRLVDQSDVEAFTVRANRSSYWRLTSLDRFDGELWSSSGSFSPAADDLPSAAPGVSRTREITQSVQIRALSAIWVPTAYEARGLPRSSEPLRWDGDSSTLIIDGSRPSSDGLSYTAISEVPELDPAALSRSQGSDPAAIVRRYEALPDQFPAVAAREAQRVTAGRNSRYGQARALQDWFRTRFRYSLAASPGHGDDALVSFLRSREGYCEQFAGAYAAMARSLGMPARVAVGFTPGEADREESGVFHVLGRHAHAWPEVWFPQVGWVPFEPTPGRGMPGGQAYTGVAPAQDDRGNQASASTTSTSAVTRTTAGTKTSGATATTATAETDPPISVASGAAKGGSGSNRWFVTGLVVLVSAAVILAVLAVRRWRTRRRLPQDPVLRAWAEALVPVRRATGERPKPAETHREFARRVLAQAGTAGRALGELAEVVTAAAWSSAGATDSQTHRAQALSDQLRTELAPPRRSGGGQASSSADGVPSGSRFRRVRTRSDVSPK